MVEDGGRARTQQALGVALDARGNVLITGEFAGDVDFGSGLLISAGSSDIFVAQYASADGAHLSSQRFGGASSDRGQALAIAGSGNVILTGQGTGVDFGSGPLPEEGFVVSFGPANPAGCNGSP